MSCEPQKMAMFLKQRCDEGQYGLYYVNGNSSLIYIPWPVAPRPNENMPLGFQLFRVSWTQFSLRAKTILLTYYRHFFLCISFFFLLQNVKYKVV